MDEETGQVSEVALKTGEAWPPPGFRERELVRDASRPETAEAAEAIEEEALSESPLEIPAPAAVEGEPSATEEDLPTSFVPNDDPAILRLDWQEGVTSTGRRVLMAPFGWGMWQAIENGTEYVPVLRRDRFDPVVFEAQSSVRDALSFALGKSARWMSSSRGDANRQAVAEVLARDWVTWVGHRLSFDGHVYHYRAGRLRRELETAVLVFRSSAATGKRRIEVRLKIGRTIDHVDVWTLHYDDDQNRDGSMIVRDFPRERLPELRSIQFGPPPRTQVNWDRDGSVERLPLRGRTLELRHSPSMTSLFLVQRGKPEVLLDCGLPDDLRTRAVDVALRYLRAPRAAPPPEETTPEGPPRISPEVRAARVGKRGDRPPAVISREAELPEPLATEEDGGDDGDRGRAGADDLEATSVADGADEEGDEEGDDGGDDGDDEGSGGEGSEEAGAQVTDQEDDEDEIDYPVLSGRVSAILGRLWKRTEVNETLVLSATPRVELVHYSVAYFQLRVVRQKGDSTQSDGCHSFLIAEVKPGIWAVAECQAGRGKKGHSTWLYYLSDHYIASGGEEAHQSATDSVERLVTLSVGDRTVIGFVRDIFAGSVKSEEGPRGRAILPARQLEVLTKLAAQKSSAAAKYRSVIAKTHGHTLNALTLKGLLTDDDPPELTDLALSHLQELGVNIVYKRTAEPAREQNPNEIDKGAAIEEAMASAVREMAAQFPPPT
ncbi:MAG: hypothetical protein KC636_40205 [Myxococcales bacterium]|nr:hypothetical protein [Myxococcales bacterium]